jgi:signal transduction histidine kinase
VSVVPQDLSRVLINLFTNAFHAVQQRQRQHLDLAYQPEVTVSTHSVPGGVEIRIGDNGTGMSEKVKAKIFQPFFTTKPLGEGTGLGLSLSHDIVTTGHGGTLAVESEEDTGTEFVLTLPA